MKRKLKVRNEQNDKDRIERQKEWEQEKKDIDNKDYTYKKIEKKYEHDFLMPELERKKKEL